MAVKILSVDDEADLESLLTQYFRRKIRKGEYEFFFAHNGLEALMVLSKNPDIEIILSDINMPEMDGLTLLAKINEMRNPALKCVMVSAYGDMGNIRQAMNSGAFDFATKPIDLDDLSATIEKAIEQNKYIHSAQQEHSQLENLKSDLSIASEIQQAILPRVFPPFPDYCQYLDIAASMTAAKDVGGDFYDFFQLDNDRIGFLIADVCGKGIPASIFMAVSRTVIRTTGLRGIPPAEVIDTANKLIAADSVDCMFVTVFYGTYNVKTGEVIYCNAGHNPPHVLKSSCTVEILPKSKSMVVGAMEIAKYKEDRLQLEKGDSLVMFTDGVTEAMNPEREEFGTDRLNESLKDVAYRSCAEIIETVKDDIKDFANGAEQSDDITMLVIKRLQ
ncbi:MAG: SpoIIE family protein phosphatase [Bacteroidales bacterium]|jgi:sigma-B regulation protein RsbU (phosphoserine phosphatase)|nr:SpoIIE family protein phosphatase [Bacteroidales bacterium]